MAVEIEEVEPEVEPSFLWIWMIGGPLYVIADMLLRNTIVPRLMELYRGSRYYQKPAVEKSLPGHAEALFTEKIIEIFATTINGIVGVKACYETHHDMVYARCNILQLYAYIGMCYFIHDFYAMYQTCKLSKRKYADASRLQLLKICFWKNPTFILHHIFLLYCGLYVVPPYRRKYLGDFVIACVFLMEVANPFICGHFMLKKLNLKHTLVYKICGLCLFITYFFTRVLSFPYIFYLYTVQYHHGDIVLAMSNLHWYCFLGSGLIQLFNLYWFGKIIRLIVKNFVEIFYAKKSQ